MERKIKLQENYSLSDVTLGWIGTHLNGKTFLVLFWMNIGIKFRRKKNPEFKINWTYLVQELGMKKSAVTREVKNLIKAGIIKKSEPGIYIWDKAGIEKLINNLQDPIRTEHVEESVSFIKKPIGMFPDFQTNELGLIVDSQGNILI